MKLLILLSLLLATAFQPLFALDLRIGASFGTSLATYSDKDEVNTQSFNSSGEYYLGGSEVALPIYLHMGFITLAYRSFQNEVAFEETYSSNYYQWKRTFTGTISGGLPGIGLYIELKDKSIFFAPTYYSGKVNLEVKEEITESGSSSYSTGSGTSKFTDQVKVTMTEIPLIFSKGEGIYHGPTLQFFSTIEVEDTETTDLFTIFTVSYQLGYIF